MRHAVLRARLPGTQVLASRIEVALDHHADDPLVAAGDLRRDVARDVDLALVLLAGCWRASSRSSARAARPARGELARTSRSTLAAS